MTIIEQGSGPAPQAAPDLIKDTTTQTFVKDVIEESKRQPVLIDFWAPWCGPCRQLTPIIEKAVRAAKGKVKLVKMNIDEHPAIPGQMGIQSIPAVIAFVNGQPADGFMGAVPESQVTAFIDKLTAGMPGAGEPNIAEILKRPRPCWPKATPLPRRRSMPRCWRLMPPASPRWRASQNATSTSGAIEQAKQTIAMVPKSKRNDAAVKTVQAAIDLAEQAQAVGPVTELERKSPQTRSIIRPASIWRPRSTPAASAPRRRNNCSPSSRRTANGTRTARASSWCSSSRRGARPMKPPSKGESGCRRFCFRKALTFEPAPGLPMPINAEYRGPGDLPEVIPVFPLPGALLLPRGQMPLNIFEPRYLAMVDDSLRDGHRLIGMIQPDASHSRDEARPALFRVGCVGASPSSPRPATAATSSNSPASRASR